MSKKKFNTGLNAILGDNHQEEKKKVEAESEDVRATFVLNPEILENIKSIAYWDRILIKDVVNAALLKEISAYKKKNGEIKPMPKK